jgi:hypothetical protein
MDCAHACHVYGVATATRIIVKRILNINMEKKNFLLKRWFIYSLKHSLVKKSTMICMIVFVCYMQFLIRCLLLGCLKKFISFSFLKVVYIRKFFYSKTYFKLFYDYIFFIGIFTTKVCIGQRQNCGKRIKRENIWKYIRLIYTSTISNS